MENGVSGGLTGFVTAGAGGRDIALLGGVCTEVAFSRSHLVYAARSESVERHERMRGK